MPCRIMIYFLLFSFLEMSAQTIEGRIVSAQKEAIVGANIFDIENQRGTSSNTEGYFKIELETNSRIIIMAIGFEPDTLTYSQLNRISSPILIQLETRSKLLEEITITGKTTSTIIREQAYAIETISAKNFKNIAINTNTLLSKVSGIKIRESGGLGSRFSLSLNGLSGKRVRIFLNNIPMDYLGSALSLNNFPINIIERIDVYKGVVPIHLSSDALGGAIHVTTNCSANNYLDASYNFGSFNTHIASLNGKYRFKKSGFTHRFKSFLNSTDNNYKVPIKLVNFETGQRDENETWLRRFHDGYKSKMFWYEAGLTDKPFADELMVGVLYADNYKEIQQSPNAIGQANIPYGEVFTKEDKWISNITYKRSGLLSDKLSISTYGLGVFANKQVVDTSSLQYNWYGESTHRLNNTAGEIENRKTLLNLTSHNYLANIHTKYRLTKQQDFSLNYSLNHFSIQGSDFYKKQNDTQFGQENTIHKQVYAGSFTNHFWHKRIKATAFIKHYIFKINSLETDYLGEDIQLLKGDKRYTRWGATKSIKIGHTTFKTSYENAIRFPDIRELFGNGINIIPSPSLSPESSHNFNLGVYYKKSTAPHDIFFSLNTFLRNSKNFIIPVIQGLRMYHTNHFNILSKGIDLSVSYKYEKKIITLLSGTYIDARDNNPWRNNQIGLTNSLYRARIPNQPYLFGQLSIGYHQQGVWTKTDSYTITLHQKYVHQFYYKWETLANQNKSIIPSQFSTNIDFTYTFDKGKYNCSLSIVNVFNRRLYDNFQQLKPGRNFNIKFRHFIN